MGSKEGTNNLAPNDKLVSLFEELLDEFKAYPARNYGTACCPFHDDRNPSLKVSLLSGKFSCYACGETGSLAKLVAHIKGISREEAQSLIQTLRIFEGERRPAPEAEYFYTDADGFILYKVARYTTPTGKTFKVFHYNYKKEEWTAGLPEDVDPVLYNLPDVLEADTVLVVEGEKDCETLKSLGFTATTNPFGAGKWKKEYAECLTDKKIIIIPDNDQVGREHARHVASSLQGKAREVRILDLGPYVPEKGDVTDFVALKRQEGLSNEEIASTLKKFIEAAEPFEPDNFSLLKELSLTAEVLKNYRTEYLIDNFIPRKAIILITAKFGGGKSLSALALSKLFINSGGKVVYLDLDNPMSVIKERLVQAGLVNELGRNLFYLSRTYHTIHSRADTWKKLKEELRSLDHRVLIVDTLKNFSKGMELNSDKEMTEVMMELMTVRDAGHTVIVLHHLPKRVDEEAPYKNNTTVVDAVDVAYKLHKTDSRLIFENFKDRVPVKQTIAFELDKGFTLTEKLPPKIEEEKLICKTILKMLRPEGRKQSDLVSAVSDYIKTHHPDVPCGRDKLLDILSKYEGRFWEVIKGTHNTKIYRRLVDPSQFSGFLPYIYPSENTKTLEYQQLDDDSSPNTIRKLNGDNDLNIEDVFMSAYKEVYDGGSN